MAEVNTSNIGFEKQIWDAACVLRGNIDASEYKSVVLGLIFLKYISDRFEAKYNELVAEGDGFEEDKDEYTAENIFFVPENARWSTIAAAAHTPEIGTVIDEAMRCIEKENKRLKDILPKNFARPELDKRRLGEVVDLFTNIQMVEHGNSKDILGRTYEYCLSKFAEQEGKLAGEFYTPACVVKTLVEILQPLQWPGVRPLLRQRRDVCAVGEVHREPRRQHQQDFRLWTGLQPHHLEDGPDEPCHPGHRGRLGQVQRRHLLQRLPPPAESGFYHGEPPFNLANWGRTSCWTMCAGSTAHRPQATPTLPGCNT